VIIPTDLLQAAVCARVMGSRVEIQDAAYRGDLLLVEDFIVYSHYQNERFGVFFNVPYGVWCHSTADYNIDRLQVSLLGTGFKDVKQTVLAYAIAGSSQAETLSVVNLLIQLKPVVWKSHHLYPWDVDDLEHAAYACPSGPIMSALLAASTFTDEDKPVLLQKLLRIALYRGHIDPIKVLLSLKADPNQVDEIRTKQYLSFALNSKAVHLETIASLIEANSDRYRADHRFSVSKFQ
jgi:hypothetical protein